LPWATRVVVGFGNTAGSR